MKHSIFGLIFVRIRTAAFRRLCVETAKTLTAIQRQKQPPSGGCVLKLNIMFGMLAFVVSRLQAAVC